MPAASTLVAALIGYRYGGLDDACTAAGAVWVVAMVASGIVDRWRIDQQWEATQKAAAQNLDFIKLAEAVHEIRAEVAIIRRQQRE